jgi:hypothetical protein
MAFTTNVIDWLALRLVAGITSALVFVIAINFLLDHLHGHPAHLPGGAFGGVGVGIALSAALVLVLPNERRLAGRLVDGRRTGRGVERGGLVHATGCRTCRRVNSEHVAAQRQSTVRAAVRQLHA